MNWPLPFLTSSTQKLINQLLAFLNLYQHAKSQLIPFVCFWDTVIFIAHRPDCQHPFLTLSKQKTFKQHFCEFVSTCKKRAYFIYLFRRNSWFKNPAMIGWEYFGLYLWKKIFCESVSTCKKSVFPSAYSSDMVNFRVGCGGMHLQSSYSGGRISEKSGFNTSWG